MAALTVSDSYDGSPYGGSVAFDFRRGSSTEIWTEDVESDDLISISQIVQAVLA
jgi:hypothetical protein